MVLLRLGFGRRQGAAGRTVRAGRPRWSLLAAELLGDDGGAAAGAAGVDGAELLRQVVVDLRLAPGGLAGAALLGAAAGPLVARQRPGILPAHDNRVLPGRQCFQRL